MSIGLYKMMCFWKLYVDWSWCNSLGDRCKNCSDDDKSMKLCTCVCNIILNILRGVANTNCIALQRLLCNIMFHSSQHVKHQRTNCTEQFYGISIIYSFGLHTSITLEKIIAINTSLQQLVSNTIS